MLKRNLRQLKKMHGCYIAKPALLFRCEGWDLPFPFSLDPSSHPAHPDTMGHWEEMSVGPKMAPVDTPSGEASHFSDGETEDWPRSPSSPPRALCLATPSPHCARIRRTFSQQPPPPHPASSLSQLEAILHTAAGVIFLKPFLSCHFSACCFLLPFVKSRFLLPGFQSFLQNAPFLRVSIAGLYGTLAPKCCSASPWLSYCCLPPGLCTCQTTHLENLSACSLCHFSFSMSACSAFLTLKPLSHWN